MSVKTPEQYKENFNTLYINFDMAIHNLSRSYINYKINPTNPEYIRIYQEDQKNLEKVKREIYLLKLSLENDVDETQKNVSNINNQIDKLNDNNAKLLTKLNKLNGLNSGSKGQLHDVEILYYQQLSQNIFLLLVMIGCCSSVYYTKYNN